MRGEAGKGPGAPDDQGKGGDRKGLPGLQGEVTKSKGGKLGEGRWGRREGEGWGPKGLKQSELRTQQPWGGVREAAGSHLPVIRASLCRAGRPGPLLLQELLGQGEHRKKSQLGDRRCSDQWRKLSPHQD